MKKTEKVQDITEKDDHFTVKTSEGLKVVSLTSCECIFHSSMRLPCHHIFALREKLCKPLFSLDLCDTRWTTAYYRTTQRIFSVHSSQPAVEVVTSSKEHSSKLSQHQKFRKASILTAQLASVASEVSTMHFERRFELLEELLASWKD